MGNEFIKNIKYLFQCVLKIIYSGKEACLICSEYVAEGNLLCKACSSSIKKYHSFFNIQVKGLYFKCYSSLYYSGATKELISRLKYKSDFKAGEVLGKYMVSTIEQNKINFDLITYVPMTRKAIRKRGYNQTKFLAKLIGDRTNKKVVELLKKTRETKDQIGLDGGERWSNLNNSYIGVRNKEVLGKNILLIDDVVTTGATAFYCGASLIEKGANEVCILTAAKSHI